MRNKQRYSLFNVILLLGLILPGLVGIFVVQAKAVEDQNVVMQLLQQGISTATFTSTSTTTPPPGLTSTTLPGTGSVISSFVPLNLYAFIQAPGRVVAKPYVILIAFASIPRTGSVEIHGILNTKEFVCTDSPCAVFLEESSRLVFHSEAGTGERSEETIASVSIIERENGYSVNIDSVSTFTTFFDACSALWGIRDEQDATWDSFAQFPYQLNTNKTLHTLTAQLINKGFVDASGCQYGGLNADLNWPTACGIEKASSLMTDWQNQFDGYIWLASRDYGIPPRILKSLIEYESQFWPGNSRFYLDEFGLGQINQLGVDVLLRRDPAFYNKFCSSILADCNTPYNSLSPSQQALIRGAVVNHINAACPTCEHGVDLDKAKESIGIIANLLKTNCQQVNEIIRQPYKPGAGTPTATASPTPVASPTPGGPKVGTTYEDMWRFTLASYHSGASCFQDAVLAVKQRNLPIVWDHVRKFLLCKGGTGYVDGLMENLFVFDFYLYEPGDALANFAIPEFVATRTPIPSPTAYVSSARIIVQVYMDRNGNGTPDSNEWIDAMTVQVSVANTQQISQRTTNGIAIFDMSGYTPGSGIDVSLPGLYRNQVFALPDQGDITIVFKFDQPVLPTVAP